MAADVLIGIGRGGLVPAVFLSHATGLPMLSMDYSSRAPDFAAERLVKLAARSRTGERLLLVKVRPADRPLLFLHLNAKRTLPPTMRGSFIMPVRLLKSIALIERIWSVMLRANTETVSPPANW